MLEKGFSRQTRVPSRDPVSQTLAPLTCLEEGTQQGGPPLGLGLGACRGEMKKGTGSSQLPECLRNSVTPPG